MAEGVQSQITLPEQLISSVDLSRTIRELEALDESLRQAGLRKPGEPTVLTRSSVTLEDLARINGIQLTDKTQREQLLKLVRAFQKHAPRIHMSLATEPSGAFTKKVTIWLRKNVHPLALLEIGLQPTLAAGCILRTNNRVFDMSLRHRFAENRGLLVQKIAEVGGPAKPAEVAQPVEVARATAVTSPVATTKPSAAVPPVGVAK